jgi:hypothetical protein
MTDRLTRGSFEESFSRADDSASIGGNWTTTGGALQLLNQTAQQVGASATDTASLLQAVTGAAPDCGPDYAIGAVVACDDDAEARSYTIVFRATGAIASGDAYGVTLKWDGSGGTETLTVLIRKLNGGAWSTLTSADVSADKQVGAGSSYDSVFQKIGGDVRTVDGNVVIRAYFESEERPVLEWTDQTYPMLTQAGSFGGYIEDNDTGVDGHIFLKAITLAAVQQRESASEPQVVYWTMKKLMDGVSYAALRGGKTNADAGIFRDLINSGQHEYAAALGLAEWWKEELTFKIAANATSVSLPPDTRSTQDILWDETAGCVYHLTESMNTREEHRSSTESGVPYRFWLEGYDADGGMILRCYPAPETARTYKIVRWRWPRPLINDDEVPDLPQILCPAIKWAAIKEYAGRDSDRTHIQFAVGQYEGWVQKGRRMANTQTTGRNRHHLNFAFGRSGGRRNLQDWGDYPRG